MKIPHAITMVLWIAPIVFQSAIVWSMFRRKLAGVLPLFFSYTILVPTREIVLLFIQYSTNAYAVVYWFGEACVVLVSLGIVGEVVWHLVRPYSFLRKFAAWFFGIATVAALGAGAIMLLSSQGVGRDAILEAIYLLERSARFLQACLLIALVLLMSRLGLTWQHYAVGIAVGFGVFSAADLAIFELRAHLHLISDDAFVFFRSLAYNLAVVVWALYFVPSRPRRVVVESLPQTEIAHWNEVLSDYLKK